MTDTATAPARDALRGKIPPGGGLSRQVVREQVQARRPATKPVKEEAPLSEDVGLERSKVAPGMYKPIPETVVFEWRSASRPFKKRDKQFFVTVTVIALLVALIFFFSGQFLPIAVVFSVVFLLYVLQVIPPNEVDQKITTYGINVEGNLYYWDELGRFWFDTKHGELTLNVETVRFPGRITVVLPNQHQQLVTDILSEVLLRQKPEPTLYEKIAKWLQDKIPLE